MKINMAEKEWNGLPESDRQSIDNIIRTAFPGYEVTAVASRADSGQPLNAGICEILCGTAEAVAKTACDKIDNPVAREACKAAAKLAGNVCRSKCPS